MIAFFSPTEYRISSVWKSFYNFSIAAIHIHVYITKKSTSKSIIPRSTRCPLYIKNFIWRSRRKLSIFLTQYSIHSTYFFPLKLFISEEFSSIFSLLFIGVRSQIIFSSLRKSIRPLGTYLHT